MISYKGTRIWENRTSLFKTKIADRDMINLSILIANIF